MFIKQIKKKNKNSDKEYIYYRLIHSYKIGNKSRHHNILNLGSLEGLDRSRHKILADRIEELVTGNSNTLFKDNEVVSSIDSLARPFADQIIKEKLFVKNPQGKKSISKEISRNYQEVDLDTIEQEYSKDIGGEWLMKQAMDKLGVGTILTNIGMGKHEADIAQMLITGKAIHPSSELESERWLDQVSAAKELFGTKVKISRHKLYKAATQMYENKTDIDNQLYLNVKPNI